MIPCMETSRWGCQRSFVRATANRCKIPICLIIFSATSEEDEKAHPISRNSCCTNFVTLEIVLTRKHSTRMHTARLSTVPVLVAANRCQYRLGKGVGI